MWLMVMYATALALASAVGENLGAQIAPSCPLHGAAERGDTREIDRLLEAGVDPDALCVGEAPIHSIVHTFGLVRGGNGEARHRAAIVALVRGGANINARNESGKTALHIAARVYRTKGVTALLDAGADVSAEDTKGNSALHIAAVWGHESAVAALLAAGADTRATNSNGDTALDYATREGHTGVIEMLLSPEPGNRAGPDASSGQGSLF